MDIKADEISKIIKDQLGGYSLDVDVAEVGTVVSVGDGIARIHGIEGAMATEMLEFPHGVFGIALNLEESSVGAVLLGEASHGDGAALLAKGRLVRYLHQARGFDVLVWESGFYDLARADAEYMGAVRLLDEIESVDDSGREALQGG